MTEELPAWPAEAGRVLGDPHPLVAQLAAPDGLTALARADHALPHAVRDVPSLRGFLTWYRTEVLGAVELPAIHHAYRHASQYEVRELLALDRALAGDPRLAPFAAASRAVGRSQLWRLLPMRDQRLVRRYRQAVEAGEACAWHVLVYGVVLATFSLPVRQGLLSYSRQTVAGFVDSAGRALNLSLEERARLFNDEAGLLRPVVERALGPGKLVPQLCS